ncbi:MAG: hypothetical protein V4858_15040 [Pseudomonadota bacterium]
MAGVFGKDPNMKKTNQEQLERTNAERKRKQAEVAARFNQKKTPSTSGEVPKK